MRNRKVWWLSLVTSLLWVPSTARGDEAAQPPTKEAEAKKIEKKVIEAKKVANGRADRFAKYRAYFEFRRELSNILPISTGMVLRSPAAQQELKLDAVAARTVQRALLDMMRNRLDATRKFRDLGREAPPEKYRKVIDDLKSEVDQSLKAIFNKEQRHRFDQLTFQARGLIVFSDPEVAQRLKISKEQRDKFRIVSREMREASLKVMRNRQGQAIDPRKSLEATRKIRNDAMRKSIDLLTKEQRQEFQKMTGKPVDLFDRSRTIRNPPT